MCDIGFEFSSRLWSFGLNWNESGLNTMHTVSWFLKGKGLGYCMDLSIDGIGFWTLGYYYFLDSVDIGLDP